MSPKRTAILAVVITGVVATFLAPFTTTPEVITQISVGVEALAASALVVLILLRIPRLRTLSPAGQRKAIWFAAGSTGMLVCLLPLALSILRR